MMNNVGKKLLGVWAIVAAVAAQSSPISAGMTYQALNDLGMAAGQTEVTDQLGAQASLLGKTNIPQAAALGRRAHAKLYKVADTSASTVSGDNSTGDNRFATLKTGNYETPQYCPIHVETDPANHEIYLEAINGEKGCAGAGQTNVAQCAGNDAQNCPIEGTILFLSVLPDGNFVEFEKGGTDMSKYTYTTSPEKIDTFSYSETGYSDTDISDGGTMDQACSNAENDTNPASSAKLSAIQDCQNAGYTSCTVVSSNVEPYGGDDDYDDYYSCQYTVTVKGTN